MTSPSVLRVWRHLFGSITGRRRSLSSSSGGGGSFSRCESGRFTRITGEKKGGERSVATTATTTTTTTTAKSEEGVSDASDASSVTARHPTSTVVVVVVVVVLATSTDSTNNASERNSSVLSRPNVRSERTRGFIRIRGTVSESKNPKSVEERERSRRVCRASH